MAEEKPIHIGPAQYPEIIHPNVVTTPSYTSRDDEDTVHLLDYWRVIMARRWTVAAVVLTSVVLTVLWVFQQTPIYRAHATIQIDRENQNILSFKDVYQVDSFDDDALRTQFEVLKSRLVARRVIENLHLDKEEEFKPEPPTLVTSFIKSVRAKVLPATPKLVDQDPLRPLIDDYVERLVVTPVRQARLATVSFEAKDPKLAATIINAHADAFIDQNFQYKWEATQKASKFLKEQSDSLKGNIEKAEDRLQAYSRENQILFTEQGRNTGTEKLQQLEEEYTKAVADRILKESYDKLIRAGNRDALPSLANNVTIASLTTQLAQLEREEQNLAVTFAPDYPARKRKRNEVETIENAIEEVRSRVVRTVQAEYTASLERESSVAKAVEQQREVVNHLNEGIIQYNILKGEVDSDKQLYQGLLARLNEASVAADLKATNIRVVDSAEVPDRPDRPRKSFALGLSLVIGLIAGVGLAFFQEYMDDTIKSVEDVARYLNVPTLGLVPKMGSVQGHRGYGSLYRLGGRKKRNETSLIAAPDVDLIAHQAPSSLMAEAYRSIRTSLLLSSPDRPPKSVLVTSAVPSEGKTVTTLNIAISLTQMGARVLLIDTDMRKPRVSPVFNLKSGAGLSSVLAGTAELKEAIRESSIPNLYVIPCGPLPPNPGELIVANRFRQLLQVLPQYFDYVILDSPPVSNVSDARILASLCDATVLVVKALSTSRYQVVSSVDKLFEARAHIAGIVLNDLDVRSVGSYYSYYYSKYGQAYAVPGGQRANKG